MPNTEFQKSIFSNFNYHDIEDAWKNAFNAVNMDYQLDMHPQPTNDPTKPKFSLYAYVSENVYSNTENSIS